MSRAPPGVLPVTSDVLRRFTYRPSRIEEDQDWAQNSLPRRTEPLAIEDLPSETSIGSIYGFSFVEKPASGAKALTVMLAILALFEAFAI